MRKSDVCVDWVRQLFHQSDEKVLECLAQGMGPKDASEAGNRWFCEELAKELAKNEGYKE